MQPDDLASEPLRHALDLQEHVHRPPLGRRAQNFPRAISRNASFSSSASASNRLSRAFCSRSSLSSLAASVSIPPYWRRQLYNVAADTCRSAAISSPEAPAAASSSARRSFRTISSAECRLRPAMVLSVPSSPDQGQQGL